MTTIPMLEKELEQAYKDLKYYKNYNERLRNQLQQKENIIKEVREYIEPIVELDNDIMLKGKVLKPVLEMLDKGSDKD